MNEKQEKKKNVRLAIGVAALGFSLFFVFYISFFVVMVLSPWSMFKLFPSLSWTEQAAGFQNKLFIFSKKVKFEGASYEEPPGETTAMRAYDGATWSTPEEIPPFHSLYTAQDKIFFFDEGLYRTFDGVNWTEVKETAIGGSPQGAAGETGIWVLSTMHEKPRLVQLTSRGMKEISLPERAADNICSARLASLEGVLFLFWKKDQSLFWSTYDGKTWTEPHSFEGAGNYRPIVAGNKLVLVQIRQGGKHPTVIVRTHDGHAWSGLLAYKLPGLYFMALPAVFRGVPAVYLQGFFSEHYYLLDAGSLKGPFTLRKRFFLFEQLWQAAVFALSGIALCFLMIYLMSIIINRFKLRTWQSDRGEYEFASLFRRFLAKTIDSMIVSSPVAAIVFLLIRRDLMSANPFQFMAFFLFGILFILIGGFLYHSLSEGLWGKTIGKKICGIVVLKDDFTPCTLGSGFARNLVRIVDAIYYNLVGAVSMSATMKWQRLGDIVAETVVVRDRSGGPENDQEGR